MPVSAALHRLRRIGPTFRSRDAVAAGVSWRDLYALRDEGEIVELSRGLYQLADVALTGDIDFVTVCGRAPFGMICLNSALAYWELSDEIPAAVHLAVPDRSHRPKIDYPPTHVHVFRRATFPLGKLEVRLEHDQVFRISDRERTVVDAFRLRHLIGADLAHAALRRYLLARPKYGRVAELAREFGVEGPLTAAVQMFQA